MNEALINQFEQGGKILREAVTGLSREDFLAHPVPGTWSIQEIVIHLADSDGISVDRMKRTAAENNPLLIGYHENDFVKNLFYNDQSIDTAVSLFDLTRKQFAIILRKLQPESFERTAVHNERGKLTLGGQLESTVKHFEHHLKFLRDKRKMLGK